MTKEELTTDLQQEIQQLEKQMLEQIRTLAAIKNKIDQIQTLPAEVVVEKIVETVYVEVPAAQEAAPTEQPAETPAEEAEPAERPTETRTEEEAKPAKQQTETPTAEETVPTVQQAKEAPAKETLPPRQTSVYDRLEQMQAADFGKMFSLNDRFRIRRDLFAGDDAKMSRTIEAINRQESYESTMTYLNEELKWNLEDETVSDFARLIEKRFSI